MSRLAVLRRPLSPDPVLESDPEDPQRRYGQSAAVQSVKAVQQVDQDPVHDVGIERAGRHRISDAAVRDAMPDGVRPLAAKGAVTGARPTNQPRIGSTRADRTVTGGWVPTVSERLERSGVGQMTGPVDTVVTGPSDRPALPHQVHVADARRDEGWWDAGRSWPNGDTAPRRDSSRSHRDEDDVADVDEDDKDIEEYADEHGNDIEENADEDDIDIDNDIEEGQPDEVSIVTEPVRAVRARRIGHSWGRFAELWVPEPLRDARVDPGRRGAIVLLLVATLAAIATAFGVWRDRPEPRPVESSAIAALAVSEAPSTASVPDNPADGAAAPSGQPAGATGQGAAASPTPPTEIVVSVTGLVEKQGIVTLSAEARVADAIAAAGGAAEGADLTGLNLAARLADGDSVVIGSSANAGGAQSGVSGDHQALSAAAASGAPSGGLVNLNTADEAALDTLPGVGPVMAQNILA